MRIADIYTPGTQTVFRDAPLAAAAQSLCRSHVGALVVVDRADPGLAIGILTDRDIVRGQLQLKADLHCLTAGDVMTPDPLVLPLRTEVSDAIEAMESRTVRRAPVVDAAGRLTGMVTLDDLLPALSGELQALAGLLGTQARHEHP